MKVVLEILFLFFSSADFYFGTEELTWRSYTVVKALSSTKRVELINKQEFAKIVLNEY